MTREEAAALAPVDRRATCLQCGVRGHFGRAGRYCSVMCHWLHFVRHDGECWIWTGPRRTNGYGNFEHHKIAMAAHRMSWILHHGEITDGLWVLHRCDVKLCVNPGHLFLGTHKENMADARSKDRWGRRARTHCRRGHPRTPETSRVKASGVACLICAQVWDRSNRRSR